MSDLIERFDKECGPKLWIREPTFRAVLREMQVLNAQCIVETGTIRKLDNWHGDGQSTIIWNEYIKSLYGNSGKFISIDIDAEAVDLANTFLTKNSYTLLGDSVEVLNKFKEPIDVLYLDSFDFKEEVAHESRLHCLMELTAAMPVLHKGSIVFVDDSPMSSDLKVGGKGTYVAEYMKHIGVRPFTFAYQVAWIMP